jgi:hypothetical protein
VHATYFETGIVSKFGQDRGKEGWTRTYLIQDRARTKHFVQISAQNAFDSRAFFGKLKTGLTAFHTIVFSICSSSVGSKGVFSAKLSQFHLTLFAQVDNRV